jgi:serine/threonine-protein kinase
VKVVDFGVAKAPQGLDATLTQTQTVIGSPGFMSPEQLRSSRTVDARSDIWALGVTLYKLTSRRMPFKAESLTELSVQIAMDAPVPLREVPPAFERVVMRCLEKDPANRYQDVMELVAALSPLTGQGPRDTTPMERQVAPAPFELVRPRDLAALAAAAAPPRAVSAQLTVPQRPAARPPHLLTTQREPHEASTLGNASAQMLTPRPARSRRTWWIAAGVIAVAFGSVLGVAVSSSSSSAPSTPSPPAAAAVAPAPVTAQPITPAPPPPPPPIDPPVVPPPKPPATKVVKPRPDHHSTDKPIKPPTDPKKQIGSSRI